MGLSLGGARNGLQLNQFNMGGVNYLLYDAFTDTRAAGAVNGTPATPGPGIRVAVDGNSKLSIGSNVASFATGGVGTGNPGLWWDILFAHSAGRILVGQVTPATNGANHCSFGFDTDQTGGLADKINFTSTGSIQIAINGGAVFTVGTYTGGVTYSLAVVLRAAGAYFFIKGGSEYPKWTYLGSGTVGAADRYAGVGGLGTTAVFTASIPKVPPDTYLPTPVGYDTFTRANGALGNSETAGPEGQIVTARAWTDEAGTWAVASNKAQASATSGGVALASIDTGKADVGYDLTVTRSAGEVGGFVRYVDADNYVRFLHDGTNAKLIKRLATVETEVLTAVVALGAGVFRVICNATKFRLFLNNAAVGAEGTIADAALQAGTKVGLYTTNTGNTHDTALVLPTGTGDEYSGITVFF